MSLRDIYERGFDEENGKQLSSGECPECTSRLETDAGEISCSECGLILDDQRIDPGPEWRYFAGDESNPTRTGAPLTATRHDRGLSSEIGYAKDAKGNRLSETKRRQMSRMRVQHSRARWQTKGEQNLAHALGEIARMTSALELTRSIREEASAIYRDAHQRDLIRGRSIETIGAGSVYAACRCRGIQRTPVEIAEFARCTEDKVRLGYQVLNAELELSTQVPRVVDRIPAIASTCEAPRQLVQRALEFGHIAEDCGIANGRNPSGVAAACVYLAGIETGRRFTQVEVADAAEVAAVTLRERYYELQEML